VSALKRFQVDVEMLAMFRKNQVYKQLSDSEFKKQIPKIWIGLSDHQKKQYEQEYDHQMQEYQKLMQK
jgi:hypothetical protein